MVRTVRNVVLLGALLAFSEFILPSLAGAETVPFRVQSFSYIEYRGDGAYNEQDAPLQTWVNCLESLTSDYLECQTPDSAGVVNWENVSVGDYELYQLYEERFITAGWWLNEPADGGSYDVSVTDEGVVSYYNQGVLSSGARFGNRLLEVHGHVAHDENENGVYDTSDTHLPNWIVYLDLNDNGVLDNGSLWHFNGLDCVDYSSISECLGEDVEPYMITQHDGSYHFRNITKGSHVVRLVMEDGWEISGSEDYMTQSGDGSTPPLWLNFVVDDSEPEVTPTPTVSLTPTPSPTDMPTPTAMPNPTNTPIPTQTPEVTPTDIPSPTPTTVPDEPRHDPFALMRSQFEQVRSYRQSFFQHFVSYLQSQFSWMHNR